MYHEILLYNSSDMKKGVIYCAHVLERADNTGIVSSAFSCFGD